MVLFFWLWVLERELFFWLRGAGAFFGRGRVVMLLRKRAKLLHYLRGRPPPKRGKQPQQKNVS